MPHRDHELLARRQLPSGHGRQAGRQLTDYRVQHALTMGSTYSGFRYAPNVSLGECGALAMWNTWKWSLLGLPSGGATGGVRCDPPGGTRRGA